MAEVKLTYRSNGKKRKEWFATCKGHKEGIFVIATYSPFYEVWGFEAYTYKILKEGGARKVDFCLVTVDGYTIGWGKGDGKVLKNHYPKGLRR